MVSLLLKRHDAGSHPLFNQLAQMLAARCQQTEGPGLSCLAVLDTEWLAISGLC